MNIYHELKRLGGDNRKNGDQQEKRGWDRSRIEVAKTLDVDFRTDGITTSA